MQHKSFRTMMCPIARTLDRVGEWWTMLILRDAFAGFTRFEQFQLSLDIAPNMLTRRLQTLVKSGLLERRLYSSRPPRHEYVLTEKGRDVWPVLVTMAAYGNRHFADQGVATRLVDRATGKPVEVVVADKGTGRVLDQKGFKYGPGPKADAALKLRIRYSEARQQGQDGRPEWEAFAKARKERNRRPASRRP
jgi:DNA-binding HxlR family transcriptional regulator